MGVPIYCRTAVQAPSPGPLDETARGFAALDPVEAEAAIDALTAGAIAAWRLEDATYWQRVKFRARLIRTMRRSESPGTPAEGKSLPSAATRDGVTDDD